MAAVLVTQCALRFARSFISPQQHRNLPRFYTSPSVKSEPLQDVNISESCLSRLKEIGPNTSLRVGVDGGGCSGFQYTFQLDAEVEEGDRVFKKDGVSVIVDEDSLTYLKGATIEYHQELIRSAFRVINNPLAEQGCSCGASFNVKDFPS